MAKKKILKQDGQDIFPITNASCVLDNDGKSLKSKIGNLSELNTDDKTSLVSAINDVTSLIGDMKQYKNQLVDTLKANGVDGISYASSWETLISKVSGGEPQEIDLSTHIIKNNALNPNFSFYNIGTRWYYNTTNGLQSANITQNNYYASVTTNEKINFNDYHTIKVTAKNTGAGSKGYKLWIAATQMNNVDLNDVYPSYQTSYTFVDTVFDTVTFDI